MKFTLSLSPWTVTHFLLRVIIGLALLSLVGQLMVQFLPGNPLLSYFAQAFNLDAERNIPTFYSALALLFSSILLGAIAHTKNLEKARYTRHWIILSALFLYLSVDEAKQLHEKLTPPMRALLNASGFLYFTWVVPAAVLLAIFGLYYLKFLAHLPIKVRNLFVVAGIVYIGGGLGVEGFGGYYASGNGMDNIIYQILATFEEFLEMLGIVIFIHALFYYITVSLKELSVEISLENAPHIVEREITQPALASKSFIHKT